MYDFTRTAKAKIREDIVSYLISVLPGSVDAQAIRGELDRLFCYQGYKGSLNNVNQERSEWLNMEIRVFDNISGALQSVAHVYFDSISRRTGPQQFTVPVRVAVITQSFRNPPFPGQRLPALPCRFLTNRPSMMSNVPSLMASNNNNNNNNNNNSNQGEQGLVPAQVPALNSVPINTYRSIQGFYY